MSFTKTRREDTSLLTEEEIIEMSDDAFAQNQFSVYYQPQYNHSTSMMIGAEALVRWVHPVRGIITPGDFISVFEREEKNHRT